MIHNDLIDNHTIRVFISSTFRDMQDERDELMKKTFPVLRRKAAERDVTLTELDLRWGITPEESENGKVVEICLREIENSVPFFIGIIGNRYGWIPSKTDLEESTLERFKQVPGYVERRLSVTEMEMQFGVLERPEDMHAYFFIKDGESGDIDDPVRLAALKRRVRENGRYPVSDYSDPEDLARQVEEAFTHLLDELFPEGTLSGLEKERIGQRAFMNSLCQNYIRTDANFSAIESWVLDWDQPQLVVTGASGLGKSALVANWVKDKLSTGGELPYRIICHFVGNGGSLGSHGHVISYLCGEIRDQYGFPAEETGNRTDEKVLADLFNRVAAEGDKPLVIVLDAVNQIIGSDNAKRLNWLPVPPKNIKILFTTLEDDETMDVFRDRRYPVYTLQPLSPRQREEMVAGYLSIFSKKLQPSQISRIINDTQCRNTLVLKTLLDELVNFGVYERLDERIGLYLGARSIRDFYEILLKSYESDFGEDLVRPVLSIIAVSQNGLSEEEILGILGILPLRWSQLFCSFRQHLIVKCGLISFAHGFIREAVEARYLSDEGAVHGIRRQLIGYFADKDDTHAWEEVPFQYYMDNDATALSEWVLSIPKAMFLLEKDETVLARYWKLLYEAGHNLAEYRPRLSEKSGKKPYSEFVCLCVEYFSDYPAASLLCEDWDVYARMNPGEPEDTGKLYIWKGIIDRSICRYPEALSSFQKALAVLEENGNVNTSFAHKHIGTIYNQTGEYGKAEACYLKALSLQREAGQKKEAIDTLHSLADNYLDARQYDDAKKYLDEALEAAVALLGKENTTVSSLYNSIAALYDKTGHPEESVQYSLKSIELDRKLLGTSHINLSHSYYNLADTYRHMGDLKNAEMYYLESLRIKRLLFDEDSYEIAITKAGLGNVKRDLGLYQEAADLHKAYLESYLKTIGSDTSYLPVIYAGIGEDYYQMEDYDMSLKYNREALDHATRRSDIAVSPYFSAVGNDLFCMDRYEEAISFYQKGLDAAENEGNEYGRSVFYYCIGDCYGFLGEFGKAYSCFEKALQIRERLLPEDDSRVERCRTKMQKAKAAIDRQT